jgi:pilus assembly protein CpaE
MAHKILAIDDHPETLSILVATLKRHGYRVVFTRSPFKGLQLAESEKPDLLLVDMNMPDMNGIEVVRKVRAMPDLGQIPIVMFTAESDTGNKMLGFQAGVDDYIIKPTEPDELIERVEKLLEYIPDSDPDNKLSQQSDGVHTLDVSAGKMNSEQLDEEEEGKLIVLLGSRGGVGTTTIAINLACVMAEQKRPTTLADFDLQQGHISLYLNQKANQSINDVADVATQFLSTRLPQQFVPYHDNLQLLLARPNMNGRYPIPTANQLTTILETMLQPGCYVVVDLGLGAIDATRPVLDRADHLLVCLSPERVALAAARRYLEDLQESLFFHTALHALMCDTNTGVTLPQKSIENYLSRPLLGVLSIPRKELIQASNKGIPLAQAFPKSTFIDDLRRIANQIVPIKKVSH